MKKIILLTILLATALLSKEVVLGSEKVSKKLHEINKVKYICVKGKVISEFIDYKDNIKIRMPVYWSKYEDRNIKLECSDYKIWKNK